MGFPVVQDGSRLVQSVVFATSDTVVNSGSLYAPHWKLHLGVPGVWKIWVLSISELLSADVGGADFQWMKAI